MTVSSHVHDIDCAALSSVVFPSLYLMRVPLHVSVQYVKKIHPDEEHEKDYDMRGLTKLERHSSKKLKGKRKRQLETLAANVSGQGFHVDTSDSRFAALLDGNDDRFGIDRTNPAYKETGAMRELLYEQSMRRNKNLADRNRNDGCEGQNGPIDEKTKDVRGRDGGWVESSSGALELSSLVKSIQQKVSRNKDEPKRKKAK